jgi:hypothetical protein
MANTISVGSVGVVPIAVVSVGIVPPVTPVRCPISGSIAVSRGIAIGRGIAISVIVTIAIGVTVPIAVIRAGECGTNECTCGEPEP